MRRQLATIMFSLALVSLGAPAVMGDWSPGDPYKMHFPQLPDEHGWNVRTGPEFTDIMLGDDWQCTESGLVTEIHFWGSWYGGIEGPFEDGFQISIYSNIPDPDPGDPATFSKPGDLLWGPRMFGISEFVVQNITPVPQAWEGFYDPVSEYFAPYDHDNYFQYNLMNITDPFYQTQGETYWLVIQADHDAAYGWGWKSSINHWEDRAVWAPGEPPWSWSPIYQPQLQIMNFFDVAIDYVGELYEGSGEYAYGDGWYFYPEYGWWNVWFYDHQFSYDRHKHVEISATVDRWTAGEAYAEIAINWSTDVWSETGNPPGSRRPPLPADGNEDMYIGRYTIWEGPVPAGGEPINVEWDLPDYNPEWISIDVRGYNFTLDGLVVHECLGDQPMPLDLAFVINGSPGELGACCYDDPFYPLCVNTTEDDCINNLMGIWYQYEDCDLGFDCPVLGACCYDDPAAPLCQNTYEDECLNVLQGEWYPNEDCNDPGFDCPVNQEGACCILVGGSWGCVITNESNCDDISGDFKGAGTDCSADANQNGIADICEDGGPLGACCFVDGSCLNLSEGDCAFLGGDFKGVGTECLGDGNGNQVDDACEEHDQYFIRGDVDADGDVDDDDVTMLTNYAFGGMPMTCHNAGDANDDGWIQMDDVTTLADAVATGGSLPAPFPECGTDPTDPQPGDDCCQPSQGCCITPMRGDVKMDGAPGDIGVDIQDLVYLVNYMFKEGPEPTCWPEADVNATGVDAVDIQDLVYLVNYMFKQGPEPESCP